MRIAVLFLVSIGFASIFACDSFLELWNQLLKPKKSKTIPSAKDNNEDYDVGSAYWEGNEDDTDTDVPGNFTDDIKTPTGPKIRQGFIKNQMMKGLKALIKTKNMTKAFAKFLTSIAMPGALRFRNECNCNILLCLVCTITVDVILEARDELIKPENIVEILIKVCTLLQLEPEEVCDGTIRLQSHTFIYIARQRPDLSGKRVCATLLQDRSCSGRVPEIEISIPEETENTEKIKNKRSKRKKGTRTSAKPLKILQITDIHYDPHYLVGGWGKCNEPLCCQKEKGKANNTEAAAGYWGDFRLCDTPLHTLEMTLEHINEKHPDIDMVYFTGDIISHKVWATSREANFKNIEEIYGVIDKYFPDLTVYPILGNHEPHPVNGFASPSVRNKELQNNWLYKEVADIWQKWLPKDTQDTILNGGYYTVLVEEGFRIIALNSNPVYTLNWWILYETNTIVSQLQWLTDTLYQAEEDGEMVHILSHVPSGDDTCYKPYSQEFLNIIERFHHIIMGIFNGHTHFDELILYRHSETNEAIAVAWNGGSLTNYEYMNYNYKIFEVDRESYEILDYSSWIFDLEKANKKPKEMPKWFKLYSFKEAYGAADLSPPMVEDVVYKIAKSKELLQLYHSFKNRRPDWVGKCDLKCKIQHMCGIVTTVHGEKKHCRDMKQELAWG